MADTGGMNITTQFLTGTVAPSTLRMYARDVEAYNAWCQSSGFDPCTSQPLVLWRGYLVGETDKKIKTITRMLSAVRSCVAGMAEAGVIDRDIAIHIRQVKNPASRALKDRLGKQPFDRIHITTEDIRRLISQPNTSKPIGLRDRALLTVFATSGVRVSELAGLRYSDIRETHEGCGVNICGKDDITPRLAPVANVALEAISEWKKAQGEGSEYIFTAWNGRGSRSSLRPLSPVALWKIIRRYGGMAGLPSISPHDLRRFVGTEITRKHGLIAASQYLGHSSPQTTARYYQTGKFSLSQANDLL